MKKITVVCIGSSHHEIMKFSLNSSVQNVPKKHLEDVIVFSDKKVDGYSFVPIKELTIDDYSFFIIKNLWAFIKTEFVLITQYDGMATNSSKWTDDYFNYDYIGAPWPNRFSWIKENEKVGNGGFSLRSAKLLDITRHPQIIPYNDIRYRNEDAMICQGYSQFLREKYDIKYAPFDLANTFSTEWCNPTGDTFGFHGVWNFPLFFDEMAIMNYLLEIPKEHWYNDKREMFRQICLSKNFIKLYEEVSKNWQ